MTITRKYYNTVPGLWSVYEPDLGYVELLRVCRNGVGYNIILDPLVAPVGREVFYHPAGKLIFDSSLKFDPYETVYVRYKHN